MCAKQLHGAYENTWEEGRWNSFWEHDPIYPILVSIIGHIIDECTKITSNGHLQIMFQYTTLLSELNPSPWTWNIHFLKKFNLWLLVTIFSHSLKIIYLRIQMMMISLNVRKWTLHLSIYSKLTLRRKTWDFPFFSLPCTAWRQKVIR